MSPRAERATVMLLSAILAAGCGEDPAGAGAGDGAGGPMLAMAGRSEGSWSPAGDLLDGRFGHAATLLSHPKPRVLVAGGSNGSTPLASAELFDPSSDGWSSTGSMNTARHGHTATRLRDGRVLVVGGGDGTGALASAELYEPVEGTWSYTGSMATARENHTATLLPGGEVLVAGGGDHTCATGCGPHASAELYDPAAGTWTPVSSMGSPRLNHEAILLRTGQVLVVGGYDGSCSPESCGRGVWASAELYDPASGTWSSTGAMSTGRAAHTLTSLRGGRVLVAGGGKNDNSDCVALAEIYDPGAGTWTVTGSMATARCGHTSVLLRDGSVLVVGGGSSSTPPTASAELYDPAGGQWRAAPGMADARWLHRSVLLPGLERVLVAGGAGGGGSGRAEVFQRVAANGR